MVIDHAKTHPELFRGWACFPDDVEIYVYLDGTRHVEMSDMLEKPPAGRGIVPPDYVCPFVLIPNNEDWEDLQKRTITRQLLNAVREAGFLASFESCLAVLAGPQVDWAAVEDQRNLEEPLDSGVVDTTPSVTVSRSLRPQHLRPYISYHKRIRHGKQARTNNYDEAQQKNNSSPPRVPAAPAQTEPGFTAQPAHAPMADAYSVGPAGDQNRVAKAGHAAAHAVEPQQKVKVKKQVDSAEIAKLVAEENETRGKFPKYPGLERWVLLEKMGDGAFSNVYRARDTTGEHGEVGIKVVRKYEMNSMQRANILKEVQIMRQLDHPNIIKLVDFSESRQYYYIILELAPGGELFHQIVRLTYFSEELSRHVIVQVAKALEYLHEERGVVHRDIKPENILFEPVPFIPSKTPKPKQPGDEDKVLTEKVAKGQFTFLSPWWDDISKSAQDLISHLLAVDPEKRFTITEFLAHPWIRGSGPTPRDERPPSVEPLRAFDPSRFGEGAQRYDFRSPGAVNLREVFDVGYAVHRQEEEAKRRKQMGVKAGEAPALAGLNEESEDEDSQMTDAKDAEYVHKPTQGTQALEQSMRNAHIRDQKERERGRERERHAPTEKGYGQHSPAVTAAARQQVRDRNRQKGAFELNLDGATLLGRRAKHPLAEVSGA
ncbi:hypothetical protein BN1708_009906 [Verticillium longisporum]|uniref:Protein kinase domain-containing protein n=1 Tax=Verticillium longisporum TaxID=100787 RepID=A0A0G4KMZ9_VERLO|nr:hypothetical protein BN1708_009906 [Verticillium longisporum]